MISSEAILVLPSGDIIAIEITLAPSLLSISVNVGSYGGFVTQVTGVGFGVDTADVNLYSTDLGSNICSDVTVTGYGQFTCTVPAETAMTAGNDVIKLAISTVKYDCINIDPTACNLASVEAASPVISSATIRSQTEIVLSSFISNTLEGYCSFGGLEAELTYEADGSNYSIICTFAPGIPALETPESIMVVLYPTTDDMVDKIYVMPGSVTLSNDIFKLFWSAAEHECSFAGGCTYYADGEALPATIAANSDQNYIQICDLYRCEIDTDLSDSVRQICILPQMPTKYSVADKNVGSPAPLSVTWTGTGSDHSLLNDGDTSVD